MFKSLLLLSLQCALSSPPTALDTRPMSPESPVAGVPSECTYGLATDADVEGAVATVLSGGAELTDAAARGIPCAPLVLFQASSDTVTSGTACSLLDSTANFCFSDANSYARSFNLATIPATAGKAFVVDCVEFGVRANVTLSNPHPDCSPNGPGGDHTVGIYLYRDTNGGAPTRHNIDMEPIAGVGVVVPFGTQNQTMKAIFDPPVRVPADTQLVVELFTPTRIPSFGGDGGLFLGGFNTEGETTPGYLLAPNCGQTTFTPINLLLPSFHLVLNVQGRVSRMEFVDPYFELLFPAPPGSPPSEYVVDFPSILLEKGRTVLGAAADGVTQVLIRIIVGGPGEVQVDLGDPMGNGEGLGELRPRTGGPGATTVTVPVETILVSEEELVHVAFALYTAPDDFSTSPMSPVAGEAERPVSVTATFTPDGGEPELLETGNMAVVRPPVALIHGLHDERASWQWALKDDSRFTVYVADYSFSHGDAFLRNRFVPRISIAFALDMLREKGYAATRADLFAHSMGGVLSRMYSTDVLNVNGTEHAMDYKRTDNYHQGDIHKLTTVNTPHYGSPVSDLLVLPNGLLTRAGLAAQLKTKRCVECGAVRDLGTDSAMIHAINAVFVPLPVHVFWGNGESVTPNHEYTKEKLSIAFWCGMDLQTMMSGDSDAVVPVVSQRAGLPPASSTLHEAAQGLHWPTINEFPSGTAASDAVRILNTSIHDATFAGGFPTFSGTLPATPPCNITQLIFVPSRNSGGPGIEITEPAAGLVFNGGQSVHVSVDLLGGYDPDTVFIYLHREGSLDESVVRLDAPPFEADFVIPADHVGEIHFSAVGIDAEQVVAVAQNIPAVAETTATLTGISASPDVLILRAYSPKARPTARGTFNDGVTRVLRSSSGTTYAIGNESIATVDSTGVVTAVALGATTLTVSNGGFSDDVAVVVESVKFDVDSDGAIDLLDATALIDCMTGPDSLAVPIEAIPSSCRDFFDVDDDDDIDLPDVAAFQQAFRP